MGISRLRVSLSIRPCARGCKSCFFAEPTRAHLLGGDASGRELQRLASAAASAPCAPPFATKRKRSGGQAGCARLVHQFCSSSWQAAALATLGGITQPQLSNLQSSVRQLTVCRHTNPHKRTLRTLIIRWVGGDRRGGRARDIGHQMSYRWSGDASSVLYL